MAAIKKTWDRFGIFGILVLLQYAAVVLFNFLYTDNAVDSDTAKLLRHAVEMSENHTLNIRGWIHTTTMEWDTSALLSAPLYSVTHNIYLASAIANSVITLLAICLIILLFERFGIRQKTALFACSLFMIPYAFGMLDYYNLLMFGGAQYIFRVLIPLMILILIKAPEAERKRVTNILIAVLCLVLIIISAISSGVYILVSCVLPVVITVVFDALKNGSFKHYDTYQYLVCGASFILALAGCIVSVRSGEASFGNGMSLLRWYDLRYYIDCFAEGFFRLMGAMPGAVQDESIAVFSLRGLAFLIKLLISALIIITFVYGCRILFTGIKKSSEPSVKGVGCDDMCYYLCGISFINTVILLVCETRYNSLNTTLEYRYLLPAVVPLLLCVPVMIDRWRLNLNDLLSKTVGVIVPVAIVFAVVVCYIDAHNGLDPYAYIYEIQDYVEDSGYMTAIFMDDRPTAECLRLIDMDREYEAYSASNGCMDIVDYYEAAMHPDFYTDEHLLFAVTGTPLADTIGAEIAQLYTYRDSVLWFDVYQAQEFVLGNNE